MKFSELNLKPSILKALKKIGHKNLTPIQEKTFPHIMEGTDIIAIAETGSGKTSACGVPIAQSVDESKNVIQALVLVPTRELALQYASSISDITQFTNIAPFAVYGGFSIETQKAKLTHGVHVLIATPGRLIDLLYNSPLSLSNVATFILDEADEMLNMGFISDIEFIINCLVHDHQTLLFSATMPNEIKKISKKYLKKPVTIELNTKQVSPQSLCHEFKQFGRRHKFESLLEYLRANKPKQSIIFCNSRNNCDKLLDKLKTKINSIETIHGGVEQSKRTSLFNRFKNMQIKTIIATDIASRGLDFSHATHVINYDFPLGVETYTHRTGRTARMGRKGTAVTFFSDAELRTLRTIITKNHLKPVWLSKEPNLNNIVASKKNSKRGKWKPGLKRKRRRPTVK